MRRIAHRRCVLPEMLGEPNPPTEPDLFPARYPLTMAPQPLPLPYTTLIGPCCVSALALPSVA